MNPQPGDDKTVSDTTAGSTVDDAADEYTIRRFDTAEVDAFLDLYRNVFDNDPDREWFAWKYGENPYSDGPSIVVAEQDGTLVGARPLFALPMQVSREERLALQPADAMVHPDHRRRGLFTRMTEHAIDRYRGDASFFFNFPNPNSLPGNRKLGWEVVQDVPTSYRIQDPGALMGSEGDERNTLTPVLSAGARVYLHARERFAPDPAEITVHRHETIPSERLAALYREHPPEGIHAIRDAAFFEWRFKAAPTDYVTYIAERDDGPRAAVIVDDGAHGGAPITQIVDALPLMGEDRKEAVVALLRDVLRERADRAAMLAPAGPLPDEALAALGFHRRSGILARFTAPTVHVARTLEADDPTQVVAGVDLLNPDNWRISFAEIDNR